MKKKDRELIFTLGDPAGIGPEITAGVIADKEISRLCEITVVGAPALLEKAFSLIGKKSEVKFEIVEVEGGDLTAKKRGQYQFSCLKKAIELSLKNRSKGLVTAPISKDALAAANINFPGHTEILGDMCGSNPVMMLAGGPLKVAPLTTHCALRKVPDLLSQNKVEQVCSIVNEGLKSDFGVRSPRLLLTALNPHGGEGGLFGDEEIKILAPAVKNLKSQGLDITGPAPADTAFYKAAKGLFDVVIAPTHDQALIPLKLLAFDNAVNVTLNLPIVRVSPGHGAALDIAWRGKANMAGMKAAALTALKIMENRERRK